MQRSLPQIQGLGAQILSISPMLPQLSKALAKKFDLEFEVLSDTGNKVSKKYGLAFQLAESLQPIYSTFGIDVPSANGDDSYTLPLPATYVISKTGEIQHASLDVDYTRRLDPEELINILENLYG